LKRATLCSRSSCSHHVQTAISSFRFRSPPKNPSFHWEVSLIAQSQQRKKSPHKKTVYQSRQSRRVLLCQATSVWVLPRESQTSRIIPTTTPPLQLVVKSRRKEDLLLLYCYYIFIYYIHRHFHTLSHKQKTHNSMILWWTDSGGRETDKSAAAPALPTSIDNTYNLLISVDHAQPQPYLWETLFIAGCWSAVANILHPPSPFDSGLHSHSKNP